MCPSLWLGQLADLAGTVTAVPWLPHGREGMVPQRPRCYYQERQVPGILGYFHPSAGTQALLLTVASKDPCPTVRGPVWRSPHLQTLLTTPSPLVKAVKLCFLQA
jgi:hypothetical protein